MARARHKYLWAFPTLKVGGDGFQADKSFPRNVEMWQWAHHLPGMPGWAQDNPNQEDPRGPKCKGPYWLSWWDSSCLLQRLTDVWSWTLPGGELGQARGLQEENNTLRHSQSQDPPTAQHRPRQQITRTSRDPMSSMWVRLPLSPGAGIADTTPPPHHHHHNQGACEPGEPRRD